MVRIIAAYAHYLYTPTMREPLLLPIFALAAGILHSSAMSQ